MYIYVKVLLNKKLYFIMYLTAECVRTAIFSFEFLHIFLACIKLSYGLKMLLLLQFMELYHDFDRTKFLPQKIWKVLFPFLLIFHDFVHR